jgi:hypothetical protein
MEDETSQGDIQAFPWLANFPPELSEINNTTSVRVRIIWAVYYRRADWL